MVQVEVWRQDRPRIAEPQSCRDVLLGRHREMGQCSSPLDAADKPAPSPPGWSVALRRRLTRGRALLISVVTILLRVGMVGERKLNSVCVGVRDITALASHSENRVSPACFLTGATRVPTLRARQRCWRIYVAHVRARRPSEQVGCRSGHEWRKSVWPPIETLSKACYANERGGGPTFLDMPQRSAQPMAARFTRSMSPSSRACAP